MFEYRLIILSIDAFRNKLKTSKEDEPSNLNKRIRYLHTATEGFETRRSLESRVATHNISYLLSYEAA